MLHKDINAGDLHSIANWIVADAVARLAIVPAASDVHKLAYQQDTQKYYALADTTPTWLLVNADSASASAIPYDLCLAVSDEVTALVIGAAQTTFRMPRAMTLTGIRASLTTAQTSGALLTVDVLEGGVSILSTKITIDNTEKSSVTATTPAVISDAALADDAEITVSIDQVGDGTAAGLKIYLSGTVAT